MHDVDTFVAQLRVQWQHEACTQLLAEIRSIAPSLGEAIKWKHPYFHRNRAVVKLFCAKDWINVYFYEGWRLDDPSDQFEPTDNARMRTLKVTAERPLDVPRFRALLHQASALDLG